MRVSEKSQKGKGERNELTLTTTTKHKTLMYSDEGATSSSCYQQQQQDDPPGPLHHADSKDQLFSPSVRHAPIWSFADIIDDTKRKQSLSRDGSPHVTDEVFNSASHLFASMLSLLGTVLLIAQSAGDAWKIVAFSIYGSSLMFLFACSTLHHAISSTEAIEARLRMLDYLAIYPLISGTFTPLCLIYLRDTVIGWSFFGVAWFLAFAGMIVTATFGVDFIPKWLSMTTYITMGWLGGILALWLAPMIGTWGLGLFVLGGLAFTVGGYIFATEHPNPVPGKFGFHEIWHVFVILGA